MINALDDKIVVEYLRQTTSEAGILIPEMAQDPQGYGKVLSMGENVPDTIKEGDILVFHTRAGMDLIQKKTVLKCLKYEIYGTLHDEELTSRLEPLKLEGKKKEKSNIITPGGEGGVVVVPS